MPHGVWLWAYWAVGILALSEVGLLMIVLRQIGDFHAYWVADDADQGLPVGAGAPPLPAMDLYDRPIPMPLPGRPRLLLFLARGCSACQDAMQVIPELSQSGIRN